MTVCEREKTVPEAPSGRENELSFICFVSGLLSAPATVARTQSPEKCRTAVSQRTTLTCPVCQRIDDVSTNQSALLTCPQPVAPQQQLQLAPHD